MSNYKNYCSECDRETLHKEWTEDGYGASGGARILTTLISLGMSNITCDTYVKYLSCGETNHIK